MSYSGIGYIMFWKCTTLVYTLVYVKHCSSKGDENKGSHSSTVPRMRHRGERKIDQKKGRHMTVFLFCPLEICGNVLLLVEYRDGTVHSVAAKTRQDFEETAEY